MKKRKFLKPWRQCVSIILIITLLVTLLPIESLAQRSGIVEEEISQPEHNQKMSEPETEEIIKELETIDMDLSVSDMPDELVEALDIDVNELKGLDDVDSADLYSVTTINEDDTRTLHIFDTPIKYYDAENNEIKFIDNTLKKSDRKALRNGTYAYENAANSIKLFLPQANNDSVRIEDGRGYSLEFTPISDVIAKAKIKKLKFNGEEQNVAEYKNVFGEGYDLHYIPQNDGVRENIFIRKNSGRSTFAFTLKAQGLVPEQMEGKTINFVKEGSVVESDTEDIESEATETEVETEAADSEDTEAKPTSTEITDAEVTETETTEAEITEAEVTETEVIGTEDGEAVMTETEATDTEDTEAISTETEAISTETEAISTETEAISTETEAISTETEVISTEVADAPVKKTKMKEAGKPKDTGTEDTDSEGPEEQQPDDRIVFTLGELFIRDSYIGEPDGNAHYSFDNHYQIENLGDYNYKVTYVLDEGFLNKESTIYPVLVDPSISPITKISDAPVYKSRPTENFGSDAWIQIGDAGGTYGLGYGFFQTTAMGDYKYINPKKITSAVLRVYEGSGTTYTSTIKAYDCLDTWSSSSIKWNNMPAKDGSALSTVSISQSGYYEFAITSVVKAWLGDKLYEDGYDQKYGVMLVPSSSTEKRKDFCSSDYGTASKRPSIKIDYEEDTSLANGTYFIQNYGSDLYLDADTSNDYDYYNHNVRQYNVTNTDKQQWIVTYRSGGYYTIANKYYGSTGYLDVEDPGASPINADIWPDVSDPWNRFKIVKNNDGSGTYRIVSKVLDDLKSLCITGGSINSGANAVYGTYNADFKYQWKFKAASTQYTLPDLKVNSITAPTMIGPAAYTFTANIYNSYSKAASTTTKFELLDSNNVVKQTVNVSTPALDGNASANVSASLTIPSTGNYTVRVTADSAAKIAEYNETNNTSTKSIAVLVKVTLSPSGSATLDVNTTKQLSATVEPTALTDKTVTWTTSNAAVATVSTTGLITGKSAGTATITATSNADKTVKATYSVTVRVPTVSMANYYYTTPLTPGATIQLSASVTNSTNTAVTWSSGNTSIATVSSTGLVTAKAKGAVTITATSVQDPTKSAVCTITVTGAEERRFYGIPGGYAPTGNYSQTFTDLTVPSVLGELSFSRTYNSLEAANDTMVGKGFRFNYDMRIITDAAKTYVIMPDSAWWCFTKNTDGTYTASDCRGTLKWNATAGEYTLETLGQIRYGFTSGGYLKYIEDLKGNRITVERNAANMITAMRDAVMSVSFTNEGTHLTAVKDDVSGRTVKYEYTDSTKTYLKTVTDAGGFQTGYEYTSGLLAKITEGTLEKAVLTYDTTVANAGLVKTITDDQGIVSTYQYLSRPSGQTPGTVKIVDNNSDTMIYYQTALDITKTTVAPKGQTNISALTENEVNMFHEVTQTKDLLGNITAYTYDAKGNLTKIAYPDNSSEQYTYDTNNNKTSYTDKTGLKTTYTYDSYSNLTKVTCPLDGVNYDINGYEYYTDNTYPIRSLLKKEIGPLGNADNCTEYTYSFMPNAPSTDPVRTVTTIKRVGGVAKPTKVEYDKAGRVIKETTPTGIITVNTYNQTTGLLTSTEIWDNSQRQKTTTYQYNGQGELEKATDIFYDGSPSGITAYEYDKATGDLIKETAPDGTVTEYHYEIKDSTNTEKEISNAGKVLEETTTAYDELDREVMETTTADKAQPESTKTEYAYDAARKVNIVTETDEYGGVTITETGWDGRLLKQKNPNGLVQINTYDAGGRIKREEYQNSSGTILNWTEYTYDGWGRVTKKLSSFQTGGDAEVRYSYDAAGNVLTTLTKMDTGRYSKTEHVYDPWGNNTRSTSYEGFFDAGGTAIDTKPAIHTQTLYDWDGQASVECKGSTVILSNAALQVLPADGTYSVMKYQYDNFRRLIVKTDAMGKTESYQYDHAGRLAKTTDRNSTVHEIKYDKAGRKTEEKSGDIKKTYVYDSGGNLASVTEGTTVVEYQYDGSGNMIGETSGDIQKTFSEEIKKEKRADGTEVVVRREVTESIKISGTEKQKVRKVYNTSGQLTEVYDLLYSSTTPKARYTYDLFGRLLKTDNANGTAETNEYNGAGLVTRTINKKGTAVLSQYEYAYYYDGSQKTRIDSTGTTAYIYDGKGQLIKSVSTAPDNTTFLNAATITAGAPAGVDITAADQIRYYRFTPDKTGTYIISSTNCMGDPYGYLYTADGTQLASNDDGGGSYNFKMEYTLNAGVSYIIGAKMYSTRTGSYTLNVTPSFSASDLDQTILANARPIAAQTPVSVSITAANQIKYHRFTPDRTGRYTITSSKNSGDPYCNLYTADGTQLASDDDGGGSLNFKIEYTLNAGTQYIIGAKIYGSGTGNYTLTVTLPSGDAFTQEYAYDANGNRKSMKETKDGITTETVYTYDKNDRLLTEKIGTKSAVTYSYDNNGNMKGKSDGTAQEFDALNRMVSYKKGTTTTLYTYYPDNMRKSKKVGTATATEHIWLGDEIALDRIGTVVASSYIHGNKLITSAYGWYLYNAHGDVVSLTSDSGAITCNYEYDPFGIQISPPASGDKNPYRYSGEYYDTESGYTYLRARYYDPAIGRFISEDSALDGLNWHVYCGNDPINHIDPSGHSRTYVIYYNNPGYDFKTQAFNSPYYNKKSKNVKMIGVISNQDFIDAWNSMSKVKKVYLYLHGGTGKLYFKGESLGYGGDKSFDYLNSKKVKKKVYLFSCHGGSGKEGNNVAWMFAKKTNAKVIACTGSVSYSKVLGKYYARKAADFGIIKTFYYNKKKNAKSVPGQW